MSNRITKLLLQDELLDISSSYLQNQINDIKTNINWFYGTWRTTNDAVDSTAEGFVVRPGESKHLLTTDPIHFEQGFYLFFVSLSLRIVASAGYMCQGFCYVDSAPSDPNISMIFECHNDNINNADDNQALSVTGVQPYSLDDITGSIYIDLKVDSNTDATIYVPYYQGIMIRVIRLK